MGMARCLKQRILQHPIVMQYTDTDERGGVTQHSEFEGSGWRPWEVADEFLADSRQGGWDIYYAGTTRPLRLYVIQKDTWRSACLVSPSWLVAVVWRAALWFKYTVCLTPVLRVARWLKCFRYVEGCDYVWCWPWQDHRQLEGRVQKVWEERRKRFVASLTRSVVEDAA